MVLKYNDIIMENDKTLNYYNITDSRHMITLIFNVRESTQTGQHEQDSFVTTNQPIAAPLETNDSELPSYAQPREPTRCEKIRDHGIIIIFILFWIAFVAVNIVHCIGLSKQHQTYNEYINISTNTTTEMLDYYCNDNGNQFKRNIGNDFFNGFIINVTFISIPVLVIIVACALGCLSSLFNTSPQTEDNVGACCGGFCGFSMLAFHVAMIVYNSIILWVNIVKMKKYCDPSTNFYQTIIGQWSIWNYINTFASYMAMPCICGIFIMAEIFDW